MDIRKIKITDLKEYGNNPVIHSKEQINKLAEIIKQYGFRQPIVIDKDYIIVAGHGRLQAVKKLGYREIDCVVADDLSEEEIRAYRLADNKIKELSSWDEDLLRIELLNLENISPEILGFEDSELKLLRKTELITVKQVCQKLELHENTLGGTGT